MKEAFFLLKMKTRKDRRVTGLEFFLVFTDSLEALERFIFGWSRTKREFVARFAEAAAPRGSSQFTGKF